MFFGRDRRLATATGVLQIGNHSLLTSLGTAKFRRGYSDFRMSVGDTWVPRHWFGLGARVDHQTTVRRKPAFIPHVNFSFPGGKYTFLLTVEQRFQANNSGASIEIGTVF